MPGFSEECVSGQHKACLNADCRCLCHPKVQNLMTNTPAPVAKASDSVRHVCPKCNEPPFLSTDLFCRKDGAKIAHGKKCCCGRIANPADRYCFSCGIAFDSPAIPEPTEEEIAALEARARKRPSDVEMPVVDVQ